MTRLAIMHLSIAVCLTSACFYSADFTDTNYSCSNGQCPPGFMCVAGMCVDEVADADAGSDGGVLPAACGTLTNLTNDFTTPATDWAFPYAQDGAVVDVSGGSARLTMPATASGSPYCELASMLYYDARGSRFFVEITEMVDTSDDAYAGIRLFSRSGYLITFAQQRGQLNLTIDENGSTTNSNSSHSYDPVAHRWWQLREDSGTLYWEVSADGQDWQVLHSAPTPSFVSWVQMNLYAGTLDGLDDSGQFTLSSLNGGTSDAPVWCAPTTLVDTFDDGQVTLPLTRFGSAGACMWDETPGLQISAAASAGSCGYVSGTLFDLRDSSVSLDISQMVNTAEDGLVYLSVNEPGFARSLNMYQRGGLLEAERCVPACSVVDNIAYDPIAHRWWRIAEAAGEALFQTSPDGQMWTTLGAAPSGFDLSGIVIDFAVVGNASPAAATFDRLN